MIELTSSKNTVPVFSIVCDKANGKLKVFIQIYCRHLSCVSLCCGYGLSGGQYVVQEDGLEILNATFSDAGNYTCRAEVDEIGTYSERFISVTVNSAFFSVLLFTFLDHFVQKIKWLHN